MSALNPPMLLQLWEQYRSSHPIQRALALLEFCSPTETTWSAAPIGSRDARLLDLRETLFGPQLRTIARCPSCDAELEADFLASDIRGPATAGQPAPFTRRAGEFVVDCRLPNSEDLLAVCGLEDASNAQAQLLRRCISTVKRASRRCGDDQLPPEFIDAIVEDMATRDPAADIQIALICPFCRHQWNASFDIVSFFWDELEEWAQRTLADVHLLARAYGWGEADILNLSPTRRQQYVEMVRA